MLAPPTRVAKISAKQQVYTPSIINNHKSDHKHIRPHTPLCEHQKLLVRYLGDEYVRENFGFGKQPSPEAVQVVAQAGVVSTGLAHQWLSLTIAVGSPTTRSSHAFRFLSYSTLGGSSGGHRQLASTPPPLRVSIQRSFVRPSVVVDILRVLEQTKPYHTGPGVPPPMSPTPVSPAARPSMWSRLKGAAVGVASIKQQVAKLQLMRAKAKAKLNAFLDAETGAKGPINVNPWAACVPLQPVPCRQPRC
jgi:hypothetical protein